MAEIPNTHESSSVPLSNDQKFDSNTNLLVTTQLKIDSPTKSNTDNELSRTQIDHSIPHPRTGDRANVIPRFSNYENCSYSTSNYSSRNQPYSSSYFEQSSNPAELTAFTQPLMSIEFPHLQAQSHQRHHYSSPQRPYHTSTQQTYAPTKMKSETIVTQPEYYVDSFQSNFSEKPSSNSANNKSKTRHVTFQEPDQINEVSNINAESNVYTQSFSNNMPNQTHYGTNFVPMYRNPRPSRRYINNNYRYYNYNDHYPSYPNMIPSTRFSVWSRGINRMPMSSPWPVHSYYPNPQTTYVTPGYRTRQLYDPNQPKMPSTPEYQDSARAMQTGPLKNNRRTNQVIDHEESTAGTYVPPVHPITILRKPSNDNGVSTSSTEKETQSIDSTNIRSDLSFEKVEEQSSTPTETLSEEQSSNPTETLSEDQPSSIPSSNLPPEKEEHSTTSFNAVPEKESSSSSSTNDQSESQVTLSFPSHELLSILQSANCISSLNEYSQQKKISLNYDYSSPSSLSFVCTLSINNRSFPSSPSCSSKIEAQKLACDQALRILYNESCTNIQSSLVLSDKHDYIAHRSMSTFQELNVNELLLGRKTLACMLMIMNNQYEQARVISIATGNICLDEMNLSYADDGTALHDCHAEILARRGLIKFLFEQIKQCKENQSSIFQYNSTLEKFQLQENITFHMYISSLPCGSASFNFPTNFLRYKQGQTEGTHFASTSSLKYPIKSCSDKIYRWNILGIQGGLLIHFLTKPIYLQTITIACETTFNREQIQSSLCEYLKEYFSSLPVPYEFHLPDIDCPKTKAFQQERQVAKLQTHAFAWNSTQADRKELLEPITGKLKNDRSMSILSKQSLFQDFQKIHSDKSLSYQQAKQLDKTYVEVKNLISLAFEKSSLNQPVPWLSKGDQLEQFSLE